MRWHSASYMKQFVEPAARGERVLIESGGRLPRVFYAATGGTLVTAAQAANLVEELIPGSSVEIADIMTPEDEMGASFRGVISIENARSKLGWEPRYARCATVCPSTSKPTTTTWPRAGCPSAHLTNERSYPYCSTILAGLQDHAARWVGLIRRGND
jgi:hypothetical protein